MVKDTSIVDKRMLIYLINHFTSFYSPLKYYLRLSNRSFKRLEDNVSLHYKIHCLNIPKHITCIKYK